MWSFCYTKLSSALDKKAFATFAKQLRAEFSDKIVIALICRANENEANYDFNELNQFNKVVYAFNTSLDYTTVTQHFAALYRPQNMPKFTCVDDHIQYAIQMGISPSKLILIIYSIGTEYRFIEQIQLPLSAQIAAILTAGKGGGGGVGIGGSLGIGGGVGAGSKKGIGSPAQLQNKVITYKSLLQAVTLLSNGIYTDLLGFLKVGSEEDFQLNQDITAKSEFFLYLNKFFSIETPFSVKNKVKYVKDMKLAGTSLSHVDFDFSEELIQSLYFIIRIELNR